ncbi:hypothetical protein Tco_0779309 [Tanacetum coccineum]
MRSDKNIIEDEQVNKVIRRVSEASLEVGGTNEAEGSRTTEGNFNYKELLACKPPEFFSGLVNVALDKEHEIVMGITKYLKRRPEQKNSFDKRIRL